MYISTSELGTPLYTGQPAGSQWCPLLTGSTVYTHFPSTSTHPISPALCPQVKLRLRLLVIQPLLNVHQWTSAVVHLVHHICLGFTDTHNLSHKHNLRCVKRRGLVEELQPIHWLLPTLTVLLSPPLSPHLSQWHSVQFKLVVTSMSSTEDHGRSQRKDTLDPIPASLEWK